MKKICFVFLFSYLTSHSIAQQYIPFPTTSDAVWRENAINVSGLTSHQFSFYEVTIIKDTVISAFTYHELAATGWGYEMLYNNGGWNGPYVGGVPLPCCGAIREDGQKKIYYYDYNDLTEYLLYDFNLSVGDTLPLSYINQPNTNIVSGIDSIDINGQYHKRFLIADAFYPTLAYAAYIEGVGSTLGLLGGQFHETVLPLDVFSKLICFSENGSSTMIDTLIDPAQCDLYSGTAPDLVLKSELHIYPNPCLDKVTIQSASPLEQIILYNSLGNKIDSWKTSSDLKEIDLINVHPGLYFLQVIAGYKTWTEKVIKRESK